MQSIKTITICLLTFGIAGANIINVPSDHATIQAGIDAAVSGDTVLVAEGEYKESIYFMSKKITVASHFVLDQDTTHISNTIISGPVEPDATNGSIVHFVNGETNESVLMGFTLSDGIGSSIGTGKRGGGAIVIDGASPRICYNTIKNNTVNNSGTNYAAGGGICLTMSSHKEFTIIDHNMIELNKISSSKSTVYGGGIFIGANAKVLNNQIRNNKVICSSSTLNAIATGGGLCCKQISELINVVIDSNIIEHNYVQSTNRASFCGGVDLLVTNTKFTNNIVRENIINGKVRNNLPGMRVLNRSDSLLIEHNLFQGNKSEGDAFCGGSGLGVIFVEGGTVQYNTFIGNEADEGAGLFLNFTNNVNVYNNKFFKNKANVDAAALYILESKNTKVSNNIFKNNSAKNVGGGCCVQKYDALLINNLFIRNEAAYGAGIVASDGAKVHVINNTLYENKAPNNGGSGLFALNSVIKMLNTICWDDPASGDEIKIHGEASVLAAYSTIRGGYEGEHIYDENPAFSDSSLALSDSSPCIGKGVLEHDFDGFELCCPSFDCNSVQRPYPAGSNPDLGAVESQLQNPDTRILNGHALRPMIFSLKQNYPNPFNPETTISYSLPQNSYVRLVIYNVLGQPVRTLYNKFQKSGNHILIWNGKDAINRPVSSGIYLCELTVGSHQKIIKLTLSK